MPDDSLPCGNCNDVVPPTYGFKVQVVRGEEPGLTRVVCDDSCLGPYISDLIAHDKSVIVLVENR